VDQLVYVAMSLTVFTGVILGLTVFLLVSRRYLVSQGDVRIIVNGDPNKTLTVQPGQSLLSALASAKVFLPSACGGGGTCAMCKCVVREGGGDALPTEFGHLNRKARQDGWRLGCQVKVKQDLAIELPDAIFGIQKFHCTVRSNDNVATFIKELVLDIDEGQTLHFEAGGYIQIYIPPYACSYREFDIAPEYREDWDKFKLWDLNSSNDEEIFRAYSMGNHPAEGNRVMLNVRIATPPPRTTGLPPGKASSYIFNLKPGDKVMVSGPYGEFHIQPTRAEMIYIGGGAGMAPLRSHLFHLFHTERVRDRKVSYWYGARSLREVFYADQFEAIEKEFPNFSFHLALSDPQPDDAWTGKTGFIHKVLLDHYLKSHPAPESCEYYICGPPMMLQAVLKTLDDLGVPRGQILFDDFGG
jgi:Na+-transporting NADH:ubiquinone oxidoreductase subunit F